ncbi:efflux RND transporter periplasmic adaptor subunit [Ramlibacter sp.]|uniref:efflux RND transporter periplasmic adaptor subunit n=1 Tax=Ramlibacter sp. TaxID=1917967 RepID=UPI00260521E2|nr:efflux RND transporter periplasmic adaptor subunit [Ramlibacter sp.]
MNRTLRIVASVAALVALAVVVRWVSTSAQAQDKRPAKSAGAAPIVVTTATVQTQDVPVYSGGLGAVAPWATVTVRTRIDGELVRVGFVEGQNVKTGQVLAQLDNRPMLAQLAQAQAQEAKDRAQLANAHTDLGRYTGLIKEDAATQQQVDTQKALVAQLEAAVQTDAAQVQYQKVQLAYTTIAAPISGRTGARLVDAGNIVHAGDANGLVVINQLDPAGVVFTLPEEVVQDVIRAQQNAGAPLTVTALTRDGAKLLAQGQLTLLNNQVDTTTGTVQLKARFPNGGSALWPGQFVNVRLLLGRRDHALTVPQTTVQRSQNGSYVYVVDAQKRAQIRTVHVALEQDGISVIDSGLKAGERVVVNGQYKLKPDVLVVESGQAGKPAGGEGTR